jgi:multidrug efflux pump subunit AcrA (membrane-fusion protein)
MKRSQIILFVISIVISGSIFAVLKANQKTQSKTMKEENKTVHIRTKEVKNAPQRISLVSYGQITPNMELNVAFQVQGELQKGQISMKPGTNFKAGQTLYRVDNKDAWFNFQAKKAIISNMILSSLPDIELDFPTERNKWMTFINDLSPNKSKLPALPSMPSAKEEMFFMGRNFFPEFYTLQQLEAQMDKYVFIAPFNGTVIATFAEPSSIISPSMQVAKIAKTDDFEVKVPVSIKELDNYRNKSSAEFVSSDNVIVGTGIILRVSNVINQQTQSADVYYSIKAAEGETIYSGLYVNVSIDQEDNTLKECVVLPRTAMLGGKVKVIDGTKINEVKVIQVGSIPDSIYVTGLKNGQEVLLEQLGKIEKDVKYKGDSQ